MAGIRHEPGKLFRPMGQIEAAGADSASRMRALSGLASLLRAAEAGRKFRRADGNRPAAPDIPAPNGSAPSGSPLGGSAPSGSNVVRLIVPARP